MSKNIIVSIVIAGLLILGGVFYFMSSNNNGDTSNLESSQASSNGAESAVGKSGSDNPVFEPIATTDEAFVVELKTEDGETPFVGKISYDGNGNSLFEGTFNNDELKFYDINGKFISCQANTCFALPDGQNGVDSSTYEFDSETIDEFQDNAVYAGKADCPAGTCDKWIVNDEGEDITFYVATDGRINKAEGISEGTKFTAVFSYQPVTITEPQNVQDFPLL